MEILQSVWSRAGLATSFLLALATAVAVPALAQSMSPQQDVALQQTDEEIYLQRYRQLQSSILTGLEQYEPLEAVRGAAHPRPLPARAAAKRTITPIPFLSPRIGVLLAQAAAALVAAGWV